MKKRILAALVLLAMIIGLCGTLASAEETGKYLVGYGKVDIDPLYTAEFRAFAQEHYPNVNVSFAEEMTFTVNIGAEGNQTVTLRDGDHIPLALQGNSHTDVRLNIGNQDDNGDGVVDENDGIFATAIAITAPGDDVSKTAILMSTDTIGANANIVATVRKNLFEEYGITGDRVMIDGSHTHHGPHYGATVDKETYPEVYYLQLAWYYYVRVQLTQAAEEAIADRAEATMSRGTIEAEEALCAQSEVGDYLNEIRAANAAADPEKYGSVEYVTELAPTAPANAETIAGYDHQTWEEDGITHVAVPELYEDVYYNGVRHDQSAVVEATRENAWLSSGTFYAYSYPKTTSVATGLPEEYTYIPSSWDVENQKWLTAEEVVDLGYAEPDVYATGNNFNSNFAIDGVGGSTMSVKYIRKDANATDAELLTREYIDSHLVDASEVSFNSESAWVYPGRPYITNENGDKEYVYKFIDIWVATEDHAMTEVDDTLLVMKFTFEDASKLPILLVNWRAHTNKNRKSSVDWKKEYTIRGFYDSFYQVSSDWCNALRYGLEFAGYRVAYFSGASGNVNGYYSFQNWYIPEYVYDETAKTYTQKVGTTLKSADVGTTITKLSGETYTVTAEDVGKCKESLMGHAVIDNGYVVQDASHLKNQGPIYGTELAQVALELLSGENPNFQMTTIDNPTGGLRSLQTVYLTQVKEVTLAEFLAAGKHRAQDFAGDGYGNNLSSSYAYDVYYWELEAGNTETAIIDETYVCSMLNAEGYPANKINAKGAETGEVYTQDEILALYPDVTFDSDGKVSNCTYQEDRYAIASYLHANSAISDYTQRNSATGTKVELNAIMLCDQIAIITAPGELYDRYSDTATWTADGYTDSVEGKNLWESLWNPETYGEPFFLGYCNASPGYMPSQITYDYNKGSAEKVTGSYETQTTSYAQGTGEDVMLEFDWLLQQVNSDGTQLNSKSAYCEHCKDDVQWNSLADYLDAYAEHTVSLNAGHYYITEDTTIDELTVTSASSVCLDLNGCTLTGTERAFVVNGGGVLSIQDSSEAKTGKLQGSGFTTHDAGKAYGPGGGTVYVSGTLNLYSGTLTQNKDITYLTEITEDIGTSRYKPGNGGVVYIVGTFNMYGGTVDSGMCGWAGGTIYTSDESALNLYGGTITAGTAGVSGTQCSRIRGTVILSGNASVNNLLIWPEGDVEGYYSKVTVKGTYTGTAKITFRSVGAEALTEGKVIGLCENADLAGATLTVGNTTLKPIAIGSKLVLGTPDKAACQHCGDAEEKTWIPLSVYFAHNETMISGHYYVDTDGYEMAEQVIAADNTVCLDLRGNDLLGSERAFDVKKDGTLNILDTVGGGSVAGQGFASGAAGGTVYVRAGAEMNLYNGTLTLAVKEGNVAPTNGGVVYVDGTLNVRGGTIAGGQCSNAGGAIYTGDASALNLYGGSITSGTAGVNTTNCSRIRGTVLLSGDASVADLYLWPGTLDKYAMLTVKGAYTGTTNVTFREATSADLTAGMTIGLCDGANLTNGTLTVSNTDLVPIAAGTKLKLGALESTGCEHCENPENWLPLSTYLENGQALTTGHYYVDVDGYEMAQQTIASGVSVCLDLKGNDLLGAERAFVIASGGTLNIQDSVGEGTLAGQGFETATAGAGTSAARGGNGGTVDIATGGTLNLYSGTLTQSLKDGYYRAANGGVVCVAGAFNMYGGTVTGGDAAWIGGNICVQNSATSHFNMQGGKVTGGSATTVAVTGCVVVRGAVTLADNAQIDRLTLWPGDVANAVPLGEILTISGAYTGQVEVAFHNVDTVAAGTDIGTSDSADLSGAALTVRNSELLVAVSGADIVLAEPVTVVAQVVEILGGTVAAEYTDAQEAVNNCAEGQKVLLLDAADTLSVSADNVTLDLNGQDIAKVTVAAGKTLTCLDSANAAYQDDTCGKIAAVELGDGSKIVGAEAAKIREKTETEKALYSDVYLKVEDSENTNVSFHAVGLNLTAASLRASSVGLYFRSNFAGDSAVRDRVVAYGVAMSVAGEPTADAMGTTAQYTRIPEQFGSDGAASTSSILKDIMKTTQGTITNRRNAAMQVYGRAYIQLENGSYLFGYSRNLSLQQMVEAVDLQLSALTEAQLSDLLGMYSTFSKPMSKWAIDNLKAAAAAQ